MKKYIVILMAALCLSVGGQTNILCLEPTKDGGKSEAGGWEITIGGGGTHIDGENMVGTDFSVSTNPFESLPNLWVGAVQSLYWEPSFAGETDITLEYSFHLFKELYASPGVFGGILYNRNGDHSWRYGPSLNLQYYFGNAFVYTGVNYDFNPNREVEGFRYGWGVGMSF